MQHKYKFKFGDLVRNEYTDKINPHYYGIFMKYSNDGYVFMNTKGETWIVISNKDGHIFLDEGRDELVKVGSMFKDEFQETIDLIEKINAKDSITQIGEKRMIWKNEECTKCGKFDFIADNYLDTPSDDKPDQVICAECIKRKDSII